MSSLQLRQERESGEGMISMIRAGIDTVRAYTGNHSVSGK